MVTSKRRRRARSDHGSQALEDEPMSKDLTQYVTTKQAAEIMGVHYSQVALLLREGRLRGIKLGHDWLVFAPSLQKYREGKSTRGRPPARVPKLQEAS